MTKQYSAKRIYLDANAFIYAIEGDDEISSVLHKLFAVLRLQPEPAYTSELTLAEVLPKANVIQRRNYFTLILNSGLFDLLPVTREVLIETADYRRNRDQVRRAIPQLPDAVHVVSAIRARCNIFVSFDRGLQLPVGLDRIGREEGRLLQLVEDMS